jgi:hypothetical protein
MLIIGSEDGIRISNQINPNTHEILWKTWDTPTHTNYMALLKDNSKDMSTPAQQIGIHQIFQEPHSPERKTSNHPQLRRKPPSGTPSAWSK